MFFFLERSQERHRDVVQQLVHELSKSRHKIIQKCFIVAFRLFFRGFIVSRVLFSAGVLFRELKTNTDVAHSG